VIIKPPAVAITNINNHHRTAKSSKIDSS